MSSTSNHSIVQSRIINFSSNNNLINIKPIINSKPIERSQNQSMTYQHQMIGKNNHTLPVKNITVPSSLYLNKTNNGIPSTSCVNPVSFTHNNMHYLSQISYRTTQPITQHTVFQPILRSYS